MSFPRLAGDLRVKERLLRASRQDRATPSADFKSVKGTCSSEQWLKHGGT